MGRNFHILSITFNYFPKLMRFSEIKCMKKLLRLVGFDGRFFFYGYRVMLLLRDCQNKKEVEKKTSCDWQDSNPCHLNMKVFFL